MVAPKTEFVISAEDRASAVLKKVGVEFNGLGVAARSASSMLASFGGVLSVTALAGVGVAIAGQVRQIADLQDSFGKLSQQVGIGVESLGELNYAASLSDVSTEELGSGITRLTSKMADVAQGSKEAAAVFDSLGVKALNADGSLRPAEEVLKDIAQRFSEFEDGSTKTAYAVEIFGRAGAKLIPLLNSGRDGLANMASEARRAGVVFSEDAAKAAEEFNDNLTRLGKSWEGLKIQFFSPLISTLAEVTKNFLDARQAGLGFFNALGTDRGNIQGQIEGAQAELKALQDQLDKGSRDFYGRPVDTSLLEAQIAQKRDRLEKLNRLALTMSGFGDPPIAAPTGKPPKAPGSGAKSKAAEDALGPVIDSAIQRDFERMQTLREEAEQFFDRRLPQLLADDDERLRASADAWRDVIDPMRAYQRQLEEIRALVKSGDLSPEEGIAAEFEVESRRNDDMLKGMGESAKEAGDAARELGLTFQSAFEDAIISGKKFSDVLAGIGQDLLRLVIRKSITEPAANWLSSALNLGSLFGKASGIDFVPYDNYPALLHRGERVVPAIEAGKGGGGITINSTVNAAPGTNPAQLQAYLDQRDAQLKADLMDGMRRGRYPVPA